MARDWNAFLAPGRTLIMGILNANPDSFYAESRVSATDAQLIAARARTLAEEGADIIDIGAESSRPGASYIDQAEELARLLPVLAAVRAVVEIPISIDTRKAGVARAALAAGADCINDISAGEDDAAMFSTVAEFGAPFILMHKQGNPLTMQAQPEYSHVVEEISEYVVLRAKAARDAGIAHVIVDPGLGFGKRYQDNQAILTGIESIVALGYPVLVGHSRKGFIGTALAHKGIAPDAADRLAGTIAVSLWCAQHGVSILRVHDVKANADALRMFASLQSASKILTRSLNHA